MRNFPGFRRYHAWHDCRKEKRRGPADGENLYENDQRRCSEEEIDSLEEASALRDIAHMPARVKCAVLGWRTLKEALLGEDADDDDDEDDE